jgi:hypothetical protein
MIDMEPLLEVPFFNYSGFSCRNTPYCWCPCVPDCKETNYDTNNFGDEYQL